MGQHQIVDASSAEDCRSEGRESGPIAAAVCGACGASERLVLGDSVVTLGSSNVCCLQCGLLQVSGAGAPLRGAHEEGATPPMERAALFRRAEQLSHVLDVRMADNILALGLRDVPLLAEFDALFGVEGHVVSAHPEQRLPEGSPYAFFSGPILDFNPNVKFDRILATGVLERQHDVLGTLIHLRGLMKPGARLLIEARNLLPAGEIAESAFFGENTAVCLSPNTLGLLLARAGLSVDQMSAGRAITLVAKVDPNARVLPRPFAPHMLTTPEQDGNWFVARLAAYVQLQQLRQAAQQGMLNVQHVRDVLALLEVAAFETHRIDCLVDIVQGLANRGVAAGARMIASAASMKPGFPREVREGFARFAEALT
jgi:hypothetical protein